MPILTLTDVSLAYGHHPLLAHVNFQIEPGERVCLVGRNGTGKSTLFRVISGEAVPDDGEVWYRDTLRISHLEQDVPADAASTIYDVVASGLGELGGLLRDYHHAIHDAAAMSVSLDRLAELQQRIEVNDGWNLQQKVDTVLSRLSLEADKRLADCSGGIRRRVMLAQALVSEPDLVLLDEPTNHMDIAAILWLEEFLRGFNGALMFITHDRTFLKNLATRIIELDRGRLTSFPGDYDFYLRKKQEMLEIEEREHAKFDKRLAAEEAWIRQGVKARRTRNEGRVRALLALRTERRRRIATAGSVSLDLDSGSLSGKLVADLRHVSFGYGKQRIIDDFSTRIMRGDRIGIIGPNGSGKSTLLKLILNALAPDRGEVVMGTRLKTAYFDQYRSDLDLDKTVRENISPGSDYVDVRGRPRHVVGYLRDFLFPPERIDSPVKALSGGERNRLLLAQLFTQPANMLVLDEPTNDLDVDTLELLEELLMEYDGTLLLVSHDRTFLDNVVTSTIVFEGDGKVSEYVGGYDDWLRQRAAGGKPATVERHDAAVAQPSAKTSAAKRAGASKLSYSEKLELASLPQRIEALEAEQGELEQQVGRSEFYQQDKDRITATLARIQQVQQELAAAYGRWELLDEKG